MQLSNRRALAGCVLTATALAVAVPGATGGVMDNAERAKTPKITVADDYFAPTEVSIKKGGKVKWIWDNTNLNTHDVVLTKQRPKKVKARDFRSSSGAIGIRFAPRFKVPGKYGFICTYHRTVMKSTVTVKK